METRLDILNAIAQYQHATHYLEIGCHRNETFDRIEVPFKVGVDPARGGTIRATSDDYFANATERFDLVFIDGLHAAGQVLCDVHNALPRLKPKGVIVLHDCLPETEAQQLPTPCPQAWTGDVCKAMVMVRTWPHVDSVVLETDWGLGLIVPRPNSARRFALPALNWENYCGRKAELLRLRPPTVLRNFLKGVGEFQTRRKVDL